LQDFKGDHLKTDNITKFIKKETYSLRLEPPTYEYILEYVKEEGIRTGDYWKFLLDKDANRIKKIRAKKLKGK